jgi:hypothetical protein
MTTTLNASTAGAGGFIATSDNSGSLALQTAGTTALSIDASQNVGIGTASPSHRVDIQAVKAKVFATSTTGTNDCYFAANNTGGAFQIGLDNSAGTEFGTAYAGVLYRSGAYPINFYTNASERMRIDSSGNVLVGTTNTSESVGVGLKMLYSTVNPEFATVQNTASGNATYVYYNTNATNNGYRFYVTANGGVNNFSGNNTNLSDERTKTNIALADNYLDKICAIPVKTFNYKDEPSGEQKTLGLIAQDVQQIAPEFVNSDGKWEAPEGESPLLSIYSTDMMFALMKSIQELKSLNDTQAETITALTARIVALETA